MKKILVLLVALILVFVSVGIAEDIPFSEWIAGQDRVVADVFAGEVAAPEVPAPEAPVLEAPAFEPIGVGSRGETVAQLQAKLIELGVLNSKADGIFGAASEEAVKYIQKALGWEETGVIQSVDELNEIMEIESGDSVNLAMGTSQPVTLVPSGDNPWCSPIGFYPTSQAGLATLANESNKWFTVSFDWTIMGADTEADGAVCFKYTDELYTRIGSFPIVMGDSSGHYIGVFAITDGMRQNGTGWLISGLDNSNRNMHMTISNFKLERGIKPSEWSTAPDDEGDGINLALGTAEPVVVTPIGEDDWCSPGGFYPTSPNGVTAITNKENPMFSVSFDWLITGADTPAIGTICLKFTDKLYGRVGEFPIVVGDSSGHFSGLFFPNDGMREFGTGWLISGIGLANRNIQVTISNFKFERGGKASAWTEAPEDSIPQ